ncbi:MAG: hypothetical protein HY696_04545 [Deltaproteobacteria bacterium]|nr:hypothetical protein [Deltaproteobacteria bacterium]
MERLDIAIRTLFLEFQEAVLARAALEQQLRNEATYVQKRVKGKPYWYSQTYRDGIACQHYVASVTEETTTRIESDRRVRRRRRQELLNLRRTEQRRAAMLRRGGIPHVEDSVATVIAALSAAQLIYEQGVLIGSHAFSAYAGLLGTTFRHQSLRTLDIDVAPDPQQHRSAAAPIDMVHLLGKQGTPLRAVPNLNPKYPTVSFIGPHGLRIDLLTPQRGRPRPFFRMPRLNNAGLAPLPFLDFLLIDPLRTVLIGPRGGIPVSVPQPTRYSIHKLIVASRRGTHELPKREKDLLQAAQLLVACQREQPTELRTVYREAINRGPKWGKALRTSIQQLSPDVQAILPNTL